LTIKGEWQDAVKEHDAIINLAGASIFSRWTPEKKRFCWKAALKQPVIWLLPFRITRRA
jgi:NAD dependent epimerase/dehydratase family enzyme